MTDDRTALIQTCVNFPLDRTPQLVLADWYADHPNFPGAAANEMFLRACWEEGTKTGAMMPKKAYAVLKERWLELIPTVYALSVPVTEPSDRWPEVPAGGTFAEQRSGTSFRLFVNVPGRLSGEQVKLYSCRLDIRFWKGLASHWTMASKFGLERVGPAMEADRPELFLTPEVLT